MARQTARQKQSRRITKSKAAKKRRHTLRLVTLAVSGCVSLALLGGGGWWLMGSGIFKEARESLRSSFFALTADAGFTLRQVSIEGRKKTPKDAVLKAVGASQGAPLFDVSVADIQARLKMLSSVRHASVVRMLPGELHIALQERIPAALWQQSGRLSVIDEEGVVLDYEKTSDHKDLLLVVGERAPEHLEGLFALLKQDASLASHVASAVRVGDRRWNIHFRDGVKVMLPEHGPDKAWLELSYLQKEQNILQKSLDAIDLRLSQRLFITLPPRRDQGNTPAKPAAET